MTCLSCIFHKVPNCHLVRLHLVGDALQRRSDLLHPKSDFFSSLTGVLTGIKPVCLLGERSAYLGM